MRVVVVTGICVENDAISNAVVEQLHVLGGLSGVQSVTLLTQSLGRTVPVPARMLADPWSVLTDPDIGRADLVIFHWGIAYELFDAISAIAVPGRRAAVHFHNTTPATLLSGGDLAKADWSLVQAQLLAEVDAEVWTYSEFNRRTLASWDVPDDRIHHVPFTIEPPRPLVDRRASDVVDLLTVGRLVPSKGVHVLLDALAAVDPALMGTTTLHIVANRRLSDPAYADDIVAQIDRLGLGHAVELHLEADDRELWELYERSHVVISPSFHEGLCVPIIEGYAAGCRAIGTDAGNLPFVVTPPDPIVPAGDPAAMATAITDVVREIRAGDRHDDRAARDLVQRYSSATTRMALAARLSP